MSAGSVGGRSDLRAVVVVPARDEAARLGACLAALAAQEHLPAGSWEVVVVLHRCVDATPSVVRRFVESTPLPVVHTLVCSDGGVGRARRLGMEHAYQLLDAVGRPDGLIATTDADTVVAPDWLAVQLRLLDEGAGAIGGLIELDSEEASTLTGQAVDERRTRASARMATVLAGPDGDRAEHHHFSGASIGVSATAYRRAGGLPPLDALEDEALARALRSTGTPITRSASVRVRTSARRDSRAPRGLAVDLAVSGWRAQRTYLAEQYDDHAHLARARTATVSVVFPARQEAATIESVVGCALSLVDDGVIDQVVVIDAGSSDGTAQLARAAGAEVHQEAELLAEWGPCLGKGDAMWRSQAVATGDIVCFLDADTVNFSTSFITGTVGPLLLDASLAMSKGTFERPLRLGEVALPREGGRVTELAARPALNLWYPELAGFDQPLAGEVAVRRDVLAELSMPVGYGVEIGMLIDVWRRSGLGALCQVDLGTRHNRHQSLRELSAMAYAVIATAARRGPGAESVSMGPLLLPPTERGAAPELRQVPLEERPPYSGLGRSGVREPLGSGDDPQYAPPCSK